ncbi:MAG: glycosyl transferase [Candidatus Moranbacteria bacterium CG23_combo_of_CG06-09_8_20_14_all_39_10]|nr:MAG: glycosyl transferase [Candidatus Moranbacteria bacterium CG23_combo_of_CG06-09_8_20_14_all_39_10]
MNKKISIIIPVYNAGKTIEKCVESILHNDYSDCEIILINDGSTDDSWKILEGYGKKYPDRMKIFNQENQGVAKTRNFGISLATAEYVMFIDCDDWIENDYLEKFVTEIETKNLDMVIGGYRRVTEKKVLYEMRLKRTEWSKYMTMAPWAKIYRRAFLADNEIEFLDNNIGEDVYFNLQAINLTEKIFIIDYAGYNWFFNEKSISNTSQKNLQSSLNVMYLLNSSYDKLKAAQVIHKPEVEFYFTRYAIWYLLFAGMGSKYANLYAEFETVFGWLQSRFPMFGKNRNISLFRPKGEAMKNKLAVYFFL